MEKSNDLNIAVIGLGYVGLPLAIEFGKKFKTFGVDSNDSRVKELSQGLDLTHECSPENFSSSEFLQFHNSITQLPRVDVYIVTVPTPIDDSNSPDLEPLRIASKEIAKHLKGGEVIIYESTVYPGVTEEVCCGVLEVNSGLKLNKDFFVGYSPERINPGDKSRPLTKILKITSGSTSEAAEFVDWLYSQIIEAGTYLAPSIKVAEAAKVIENTQRDVNIALVNELAVIFGRLGIDTEEVLLAAETKWNFMKFRPGLVGGHCISVDPYYLSFKAQSTGYQPDVILASRKINDGMGSHVASQLVKYLVQKKLDLSASKILILGYTFKENCSDTRNTKVIDIVRELEEYLLDVDVYDPKIQSDAAEVNLINSPLPNSYDAIVIAVSHQEFVEMGVEKIKSFGKSKGSILYDLKYLFSKSDVDFRL